VHETDSIVGEQMTQSTKKEFFHVTSGGSLIGLAVQLCDGQILSYPPEEMACYRVSKLVIMSKMIPRNVFYRGNFSHKSPAIF
jgi:hypothetical protein